MMHADMMHADMMSDEDLDLTRSRMDGGRENGSGFFILNPTELANSRLVHQSNTRRGQLVGCGRGADGVRVGC